MPLKSKGSISPCNQKRRRKRKKVIRTVDKLYIYIKKFEKRKEKNKESEKLIKSTFISLFYNLVIKILTILLEFDVLCFVIPGIICVKIHPICIYIGITVFVFYCIFHK